MKIPNVSVCIPAYKDPSALERLLTSIEKQDYKDLEVVITDDSPAGEIDQVISTFKSRLPIKYFKNIISLGTPANWNESIRRAEGNIIKIMHTDDWFERSDALSRLTALLSCNPMAAFGFSSCYGFDVQINKKVVYRPTAKKLKKIEQNPTFLLQENFIGAPSTTIFFKSKFREFDTKMRWLVDIDFYTSMLAESHNKYVFDTETLVNITMNSPTQVTAEAGANSINIIRESTYYFQKYNLAFGPSFYLFKNLWSCYEAFGISKVSDMEKHNFSEIKIDSILEIFFVYINFLNRFSKMINSKRVTRGIRYIIGLVGFCHYSFATIKASKQIV